MPKFSLFTPLGLLKLGAKQSPAELFYDQQRAAIGEQFDTTEGTHVEASMYARAMAFGRTAFALERAADQAYPATITELIPTREAEYGVVPGPLDSIADRRATLAAARLLPRGATITAIEDAFATLLGDDFLGVRATPWPEAVNYPTNLGDQPMNLQTTSVERKFIRVLDAVTLGGPGYFTLRYEALDPNEPTVDETQFDITKQIPRTQLLVGDVLTLDSENATRTEVVTVQAVDIQFSDGDVLNDPAYRRFSATISNTHGAGFSATTIPFPLWASTKRHYLIVLTETAALDAEKRRKADELAARIFSCVATWSVAGGVVSGGSGVAGPFKVGEGLIGITPIGTMYF